MGQADLHIHSTYSDGQATVAQILNYVEFRTSLDVIAITDHDQLTGALQMRDFAARKSLRIQVIAGMEVSTRDGHLLALNVEQPIPAGLAMAETIQAIHEQHGIAIVAHPLSPWCPSARLDTLRSLVDCPPDAIEVHNASFAGVGSNARVRLANRTLFGWAETGSSDAHNLSAIGSSLTRFPGTTIADLLAAIARRTTSAVAGYWPTAALAGYGYASVRDSLRMRSRSLAVRG
ncbi:MAG TPA: PHP domain-containing protein [Aggregatilineaceae bacterium]|nr:PHP domain-containing protein [Aggregatilineaceae bacterium]